MQAAAANIQHSSFKPIWQQARELASPFKQAFRACSKFNARRLSRWVQRRRRPADPEKRTIRHNKRIHKTTICLSWTTTILYWSDGRLVLVN